MFENVIDTFKILNGVFKDNAIPKDQLHIHDEETCPCGSGKSYSDCCKGKPDKTSNSSKKPVEVLMMERMRSELKQMKYCLHPDHANCRGRIKEAHALQNNKILSLLGGSENHVMIQDHTRQPIIMNDTDDELTVLLLFEKIGRNKATTQSCFCDFHDTEVFKPIEDGAPAFDPQSETMKFIYAYKAFIFEYSKQFSLMEMMKHNFAEKPMTFSSSEMVKEYRLQQMRMNEFKPIKDFYDSQIMAGQYNGVYTCIVKIPRSIGFACYTYVGLDYDLNGQKTTIVDSKGKMHRLSMTILPEDNCSYILLSCLDSEEKYYRNLFQEIYNSELDKILFYFNLMLPLYSENIVLSEELWNKHDIEGQLTLTHMANLHGYDQLIMSSTIAMSLSNAAKSRKADYSINGKYNLFQPI